MPNIFSRKSSVLFTVLTLFIYTVSAQAKSGLTQECEEALALSALPERVRDQASVYTWDGKKFNQSIASEGPFSCIVERNHVDSIIPQCMDAAGKDTILPALMYRTELILRGESPAEVASKSKVKLTDGTFSAPARPGLSYMTSAHNHIYVAAQNEFINVKPHLMFYAPGLNNEHIGGSFEAGQQNRGLPFIIEEGVHGYMISFIEKSSSSEQVIATCQGQIDLGEVAMVDDHSYHDNFKYRIPKK